ncbi:MAG: hypothetical protein U0637_14610 [Phycisphaerales bacterium]
MAHAKQDGPGDTRLQRVEETLGFVEHEQEQLGAQVLRLQQQVQALTQRVQKLEAQLEQAQRRAAQPPDDPA